MPARRARTLEPQRLCLLAAHFPPDASGMGDYTYFLAAALARIGCEVHVLTSVGELDQALYPLLPGLHVHRVVTSWGLGGLRTVYQAIRSLAPGALVIQYTPHAYNRRGITLGVNLLPLLVRLTAPVRVIVNFHELFIPFSPLVKHSIVALWQRLMAVLLAIQSHALTAISGEWPRRLRRIGVWKPVIVIPVGSNIPQVDVGEHERRAIRDRLGVDEATLLVGCFGSAGSDRKGAALLQAIDLVNGERPAKLVWIGKTGAHPWAEENSDCVVWTGLLPHPEVSRVMSACDVFALPFADGVSTKRGTLAAALQHSLPVLTTKGKRVEELFVHRENVYLTAVDNDVTFTSGLLELSRSPGLRARLGEAGRALYERHFRWEVIAQQVLRQVGSQTRQ